MTSMAKLIRRTKGLEVVAKAEARQCGNCLSDTGSLRVEDSRATYKRAGVMISGPKNAKHARLGPNA